MALQISNEDTDFLLNNKNALEDVKLDKYRTAGQVSQSALKFSIGLINDSYHLQKYKKPLYIHEICALTDSFIEQCLKKKFSNKVTEKGIAHPTTIDVDEIAQGWGPELDDNEYLSEWNKGYIDSGSIESCHGTASAISGILKHGDVVKITVGCHIDGYTAQLSHSIVVYPTVVDEVTGQFVAVGPLLGSKADAIAAAHIAVESVTNLLSCALSIEKLPRVFPERNVTGRLIRLVVDTIAKAYNCAVVPGSRVRRVRRFLAGQNEGVVAERDVKGVYWVESHQEAEILAGTVGSNALVLQNTASKSTNKSAIATDEFVVLAGEVYLIDLQMAPLEGLCSGLVTLQTLDQFSGKSRRQDTLVAKSAIICRDFAKQHIMKLKTSRQLLRKLDDKGVYPTKLSHLSSFFPLDIDNPDYSSIIKDLKTLRFGLSEVTNNYLATEKPIKICKLIPWNVILDAVNPTGPHGVDAKNLSLPGYEIPLPQLGLSFLKLNSLLKEGITIPVARESLTVVLCGSDISSTGKVELLKLNGGVTNTPSWIHSKYELNQSDSIAQGIFQLAELANNKRFGLTIR